MGPAFDWVPGSLINIFGVAAFPIELVAGRWLDAFASIRDLEALVTHLRVLRWALDEFAMPAQLFEDVVGRLCRDDELYRGALMIAGQRAAPAQLPDTGAGGPRPLDRAGPSELGSPVPRSNGR